ncbi:MAG: hypothetical protein ACMV0I_00960 [Pseudomonas sp.]
MLESFKESSNSMNRTRIIPLQIDVTGSATIDLYSQGIPTSALIVPTLERWDATAYITREKPSVVRAQVMTLGRTIAPMPWNGIIEPLELRVLAIWEEDVGNEQKTMAWELPAALTHTIYHGMGTRNMVESIKSDGQAIDAAFTVLDENRVRIDLVEAMQINVSVVFIMPS